MRFALIGQPNCGKSTLFNQVAGYKAETGNFPGTTVTYIESKVRVIGSIVDLVDLPGTYSLLGTNPAERVTFEYLAKDDVDLIINIIDATRLTDGLSLTLELLELGRPLVVALNMIDEAARLGIEINGKKLQNIIGVPVLPLIARKGRGVRELFTTAYRVAKQRQIPKRLKYASDIEHSLDVIKSEIDENLYNLNADALSIKLLEGDQRWWDQVQEKQPNILHLVRKERSILHEKRGQPSDWIIYSERHSFSANIARDVIRQGEKSLDLRDRLDDFLLHPFWGYVFLIIILLLMVSEV